MISNAAKSFDILATSLNALYNYFNLTKLFSDLYLIKFLDTSSSKIVLSVYIFSKNS